jgi:glycosyltransferase involved in cell wall biosynthesis
LRGRYRLVTHQLTMAPRLATRRCRNAASRAVRALPEPTRAWMGGVIAWRERLRGAPPICDWSTPFIGSRGASHGLAQMIGATDPAPRSEEVGPLPLAHRRGQVDAVPALRCLLVTSRLDAGGIEEVVAFLARRLPARGVRTAVLHATSEADREGHALGRVGRMLQLSGVEVHRADATEAPAWIERWCPNVISAHGAPKWVFDIARRSGIPYVDNLHGMYTLFGADWRWHSQATPGRELSAVVAVSELLRQDYLRNNQGFPAERIVTIPNGIDDERRSRGDRFIARQQLGLTNEYLFVSLARQCLQKNTYGLVTAFGQLARHRPEAHLVIAGRVDDSRYYRNVLKLRDGMPCQDRVHLRDHLASPVDLLAAADGFVLDSFFEGWSLAPMEALSAGLPVVLSDVGGAREQVGDAPARGYVVTNPLGDPLRVGWDSVAGARFRPQANCDELVSAMERLVANRDAYLSNRAELAAESASRFSAEACLARHTAVLSAAAAQNAFPTANDGAPCVVGGSTVPIR